ncbi:MAG: SpoIIIAH-like family protein [Thermoanaerobacteraceae bacterium]|nr:SpoIIIAH-like family protein [Thermoanaerobacteraceae bacterium]
MRKIKINDKMRVLIALVLTFGVLAYLVQGEQEMAKPGGTGLPSEGPAQQAAEESAAGAAASAGSSSTSEDWNIKAEEILEDAANKAGKGDAAFFVEYRLERDRRRSQQIELLKQIVDNPNATGEGKQEAQKRLVDLTQQMDLELQLEKLIVAKGYQEAAVFIQPNAVNVIVMADQFTAEDAYKIGDLVSRSTGRPREQITIIPRQ